MPVEDKSAATETVRREKASADPGSVGAPMSGVVVEVRVKEGQEVKKGDILCVQSAMKVSLFGAIFHARSLIPHLDGECRFRACFWTHQAGNCCGGRQLEPGRSPRRNWSLRVIDFWMLFSAIRLVVVKY